MTKKSTFFSEEQIFAKALKLHSQGNFSEAAKLMGYKSRSQLYKMKRDGWLNDYIVEIAGKNYLDLQPRGKASLDNHIMGIIQWRPSNPIRELETVVSPN